MVLMEGSGGGREVLKELEDLVEAVGNRSDAGASVKLKLSQGRKAIAIKRAQLIEGAMQIGGASLFKSRGGNQREKGRDSLRGTHRGEHEGNVTEERRDRDRIF